MNLLELLGVQLVNQIPMGVRKSASPSAVTTVVYLLSD